MDNTWNWEKPETTRSPLMTVFALAPPPRSNCIRKMEYLRGLNQFGLCSRQDYYSSDQSLVHRKLIVIEFITKGPCNTNQALLIQGFHGVTHSSCVCVAKEVASFFFIKVKEKKSSVAENTLKTILVKGQMMPSISFYCSHLSFYWYVYSEGNALYPLTLSTINNSLRSRG